MIERLKNLFQMVQRWVNGFIFITKEREYYFYLILALLWIIYIAMKYIEILKKLDSFSLLLFLNDKNDEDDDNSDLKELQLSLRSTSHSQFLYYKIKEFLKSSYLVKNTKKIILFCDFTLL